MTTSTISVKYRPIKIAFLVQEGNINDLVKVAGINTLLWGGIYNPIIPVSDKNRDFINKLLELFNIDVFYKVSDTDSIKNIVDDNPFLKDPSHIGENIFYEDWHSKKNVLAYLDSKNIIDLYWEKELKHKPTDFKSNCTYVEWDKDSKYSNLFSILFGYFPDSYDLKDDYKNAFIKGLKSNKINITKNISEIDAKIHNSITPIISTRLKLRRYGGSWRREGFYIGDEKNFTHLLNFWNLRATGIRIEFLPKDNFKIFQKYIQSYVTKIDNISNKNQYTDDRIYIYYQGKKEPIEKIVKQIVVKNKHFCFSHCDKIFWNGLNIIPSKFYFSRESILANTERQYGRYYVSFALPEKKFLTKSDNNQSLVAVVDPITEFTYPRHSLKPPFIRKLNEFYSREITINPQELRIEQEGVGIIIKASNNHLSLFPIHHEKIIRNIFELAGLKSKISQAGLLTQNIITNMRERDPLEACRIFKITGVRELLKSLKSDDTILWSQATKTIWEYNFKKFHNLYIETRDKSKLDTKSVFNFLIKKNIFKPKLNFFYKIFTPKKKFKCRSCGLNKYIKINNYENSWICPYCEHKHNMPQYITEDLQGVVNKYFKFIKSGLFSKDNNQEGAIPVILTLLTFNRIFFGSDLFHSTSLELKNHKRCEVDFIVLNYQNKKIELGIAESKSKGQTINKEDVENLKYVQDKINNLNIECYIIFSKTNNAFEVSELKLFMELRKEGRKLILLTNNELEPYDPYWELEKTDKLPNKYAMNMEEMYANSMFLYLNN